MSNPFSKINVGDAVKHRSKNDLSRHHLTTLNFGQIVPLFHEELVPGDSFNVHSNIFSRMQSLVVPTYANCSLKTLSVFCPYYQCAKDFDAWYSGQAKFNGVSTKQRIIDDDGIITMFTATPTSTDFRPSTVVTVPTGWTDVDGADRAWFDFRIYDAVNSVWKYYKLTQFGKYMYKVFRSLGYQFPTYMGTDTSVAGSKHYSAMPLLAFFKVYNDLMSQATKVNESNLSKMLYLIKLGNSNMSETYDGLSCTYTYTTGRINGQAILAMFEQVCLMYKPDYFTGAWEMPNAVIYGNNSSLPVPSYAQQVSSHTLTTNSAGVTDNNSNVGVNSSKVTQRSLDFLRAFDNFVRRNNYSGSRAVQQIYSRFGIKTDDFKSHFPDMISTDSMPIQVGDVMCQADTYDTTTQTGSKVGDYTGKGIISGNNGFSYKSSEHGMLFLLGWIQVSPVYADGFDRAVLRTDMYDYYQPEFDGLSGDVISLAELSANNKTEPVNSSYGDDKVFGFTEKYNAYRYGRSQITGDFNLLDGMESWHFGRDLSIVRKYGHMFAQDNSVVKQIPVESEFNRIFSVQDGEEDKFYITCFFDVNAFRPMGNTSDAVDLGSGPIQLDRNGNVVE